MNCPTVTSVTLVPTRKRVQILTGVAFATAISVCLTFAGHGGFLRHRGSPRWGVEIDGRYLRNLCHPLCDHAAAHASHELPAAGPPRDCGSRPPSRRVPD